MKTTEPRSTHLKDYSPPAYRVAEIALDFHLDGIATLVTSTMAVERVSESAEPLKLDGRHLKLISAKLDGKMLESSEHAADESSFTLHHPPQAFRLELVT